MPAYADVIWPSLYITQGMLSLKVIILGLIAELFFVKYFAKLNWKKASIITILMNFYYFCKDTSSNSLNLVEFFFNNIIKYLALS